MVSDEHLYLTATTEFESDSLRAPALFAKCMALCEGSKERAKYMYINERVEALRKEEAEEQCRQAEIQAAKAQEQWPEYLDSVVQELKSINWACGERENGKWVAYGPNYQFKTFKNHHELLDFYHEISPNTKTETHSSLQPSLLARVLYGDLPKQAPAIAPKLPPAHTGSDLTTGRSSIKGVGHDASEEQSIGSNELTWGGVGKWTGILYVLSMLGFLIKISVQMGGEIGSLNIPQLIAIVLLPATQMALFVIIAVIYLAFKKFKVSDAGGFLGTLGWIYVIAVAFRLVSGQQL